MVGDTALGGPTVDSHVHTAPSPSPSDLAVLAVPMTYLLALWALPGTELSPSAVVGLAALLGLGVLGAAIYQYTDD
jgi:hypothetical protein